MPRASVSSPPPASAVTMILMGFLGKPASGAARLSLGAARVSAPPSVVPRNLRLTAPSYHSIRRRRVWDNASCAVTTRVGLSRVGYSARGRLLVVCHVERGAATRLISARRATAHERKRHEG